MKPDFVEEKKFPYDFPGNSSFSEYVKVRKPDLVAIHLPGVGTWNGAKNFREQIDNVRRNTPLVILEGFPVADATIEMYDEFKANGIPMAKKDDHEKITKILADLLNKKN